MKIVIDLPCENGWNNMPSKYRQAKVLVPVSLWKALEAQYKADFPHKMTPERIACISETFVPVCVWYLSSREAST